MSDKIEVGAQASGEDGINRLVTAIDRLEASLARLGGNNNALTRMAKQMAELNSTMKAGFEEMISLQSSMEARSERQAAVAGARRLAQEEEKAERLVRTAAAAEEKKLRQQVEFETKQDFARSKAADRALEAEISFENKRASALQAIQERRDIELNTARAKEDLARLKAADRALDADISFENKRASTLQAMQERRDVELNAARSKELLDYVSFWEKQLAAQEVAQARQLDLERSQQVKLREIRAAEAAAAAAATDRQRVLNTNFISSPISTQISTAERAQVYSNLGGNAVDRYGSAAAAADIAALRAQYAALPSAVRNSATEIASHNAVMAEGHALARGFAGSLGGLWLTYGSLVPLAAGAALAASLKAVVSAGKEVEYQLKFVEALGNGKVGLDDLLHITDQTIVSVKEAAEGMRALAQNGLSASDSLKVLPSILNLAVIGEMSVSNAALAATGTVSAFGLQLSDLDRVANIFAKAAATSNTSVSAITESMKQASTVAGVYGASVEETAAALGVLAKVNITGTAAGTAYTNMLTNLFTPTEKAKKALEELKITTDNGNGGLKNSTQLLNELRIALAGFNDSSKATFLGDIFTVRGQKGVATILSNWDEYIAKTNEAKQVTNFMGEAVSQLEDTTTGALNKLANNASSSFNKAFVSSSPALQNLITQLAQIAGSRATADTLTAIADALLRVTQAVVDHSTALSLMLASYVTIRGLSALPKLFADIAKGVTALTFSMRGLATATGWIGLAVTAAITAYELFIAKTSDADKADQRRQNSISVNIEFLDREIERLKRRNELWNPDTLTFDAAPKPPDDSLLKTSADALTAKRKELADIEARLRTVKNGDSNIVILESNRAKLQRDIAEGQNKLWEMTAKQEEADVQRSVEATRRGQESTANAISNFVRQGEAYDKLSANYAGKDNEAFLRKTQQAKAILDQLKSNSISNSDAVAQLSQLKAEASSLLDSRAPKRNKAEENDALKARIEQIALEKQLFDIKQKTELLQLDSDRRAGTVGELEYLSKKNALEKAGFDEAERQAKRDAEEVRGVENKTAALQKYNNLVAVNSAKSKENDLRLEIEQRNYLNDLQQRSAKIDADTYTKKGEYVEAFLSKFSSEYGTTIAKLKADLDATTDPAQISAIGAYLQRLYALRDSGVSESNFTKVKQDFETALSDVQSKISSAKEVAAEDGGLSGSLGLAKAADDIRSGMLPALQNLSNQLQVLAKDSGVSALADAANKAQASLSNVTRSLIKDANPFGDAWKEVWKGVESAGHNAFLTLGKAGTSFADQVGEAIRKSILELLYQLTVKKFFINIGAALSGSGGGEGGVASLASALNPASSIISTLGSGASLINSVGQLTGLGGLASVGSGLSAGLGASTADAALYASYAGTGNIAAGATAGFEAGSAITSAIAAIPGWGWAALGAAAIGAYLLNKGPEDHTRLNFTSNNTAGNISINERGNEGRSDTYVAGAGTKSAFGTFGVSSTFWMAAESPVVKSFLDTVGKTDDALAAFLTTAERAQVSDFLTGKVSIANTGKEGSSPNANGELDGVFKERIHNIFEGLGAGLSALTDGFSGTSQELATEAAKILQFRQALIDSGEAVFGVKVTLQEVAALKLPTEPTSAALTRITSVFNTTNQIASIAGKSAESLFGVGLSSFGARDSFVQAAGGLETLNKQVTFFSQNFLTKAQQLAPANELINKTLTSLGLPNVKTRTQFADAVSNALKDNNTQLFTSLLNIAEAFATVTDAVDGTAKSLQDQIDELTKTRVELLQKERDALDPANRALFDQLQQAKKLSDAKKDLSDAYDREVDKIKSTNDRLTSFAENLRKFRDGLLLGSSSPLTPQQKYAEASNQFNTTLAKARGGDAKAQDDLQSIASAFLDASRVANASGSVYTSDFQRVTDAINEISTWADQQVDVGKASLEALQKQVGALVDIRAAVLSLPEALAALMNAQNPKADQSQRDAITSLYQQILGRAPEQSGLDYWLNALKNGVSIGAIADAFRQSNEYAANHAPSAYNYSTTPDPALTQMSQQLREVTEQLKSMQNAMKEQTGATIESNFAATSAAAEVIVEGIQTSQQQQQWNATNKVKIE